MGGPSAGLGSNQGSESAFTVSNPAQSVSDNTGPSSGLGSNQGSESAFSVSNPATFSHGNTSASENAAAGNLTPSLRDVTYGGSSTVSTSKNNLSAIANALTNVIKKVISAGAGFTTVLLDNGAIVKLTGTRNLRNNNPGNIEYGNFAKNNGAVGTDGRFAVFPTLQAGIDAALKLITTGAYRGLTLAQTITKYAPPSENNTPAYIKSVSTKTGFAPNTIISNLTQQEQKSIVGAMFGVEGGNSQVASSIVTGPTQVASNDTQQAPSNPIGAVSPFFPMASKVFEIGLGVATNLSFTGDAVSNFVNNGIQKSTGFNIIQSAQTPVTSKNTQVQQVSNLLDNTLQFVNLLSPSRSIADIASTITNPITSTQNALNAITQVTSKSDIQNTLSNIISPQASPTSFDSSVGPQPKGTVWPAWGAAGIAFLLIAMGAWTIVGGSKKDIAISLGNSVINKGKALAA